MNKIITNPIAYVFLYLLFMIPTYYFPYLGSNSSLVNATGVGVGAGMNPAFWWHLIALIVLIALAWLRGSTIDKGWLVVFPIIAAVFDLVPGLSSIPLIPTVMHLLAVILGVTSVQSATNHTSEGKP